MEFVDGVNLRQAMRAGRFTPPQALAVVPGICDALQAAHAQGVWHRDIKPENILLDARGGVKIADFGIARIVGDPARDFTLTSTGAALGSAAYMAPEQHEKPHDVDHRADIYSLGVVLYEMLTGELPLGRFPAPSQRAAVSARIDEIVFQTLEKERELRQQSAAEVKTDVTGAAKNANESALSHAFAPLTPKMVAKAAIVAGISLFTAAVFFSAGSDQGLLISLATVPFVLGLFGLVFFKSTSVPHAAARTLAKRLGITLIVLMCALAIVGYLKQLQREQIMVRRAAASQALAEKAKAVAEVKVLPRPPIAPLTEKPAPAPAISVEEVFRKMNAAANESNGGEFWKLWGTGGMLSPELVTIETFFGKLEVLNARPSPQTTGDIDVYAGLRKPDSSMSYMVFLFGYDSRQKRWKCGGGKSAPFRAASRVEFRPEKGGVEAILRTHLRGFDFRGETMFRPVKDAPGQFDIFGFDFTAESAEVRANSIATSLADSLGKFGLGESFKILTPAQKPGRPWMGEDAP